jgi:protein-L-isoaspartate(D-aspartate) O-methyltransferase
MSDALDQAKEHMIRWHLQARGIHDPRVVQALRDVPREAFVQPSDVASAYGDHPLLIGYGQTISQPYMVAAMTEILQLVPADRVLEVGTGSGYQAAVLSRLVLDVYTVEVVPSLCESARELLERLGYANVHVHCADGYYGWREHAPYDAIIVTCAPDHIPHVLVDQLGDGGRMVLPVGPAGDEQILWLLERRGQEIKSQRIMSVAFVPLTGSHTRRNP